MAPSPEAAKSPPAHSLSPPPPHSQSPLSPPPPHSQSRSPPTQRQPHAPQRQPHTLPHSPPLSNSTTGPSSDSNPPTTSSSLSDYTSLAIFAVIFCGGLLSLIIVSIYLICSKRRNKQDYLEHGLPPDSGGKSCKGGKHDDPASSELSSGDPEGTPSSLSSLGAKCGFSYEELAAATDGFCKANLLGQGGFGVVHRGVLADQREVAVKSLKAGSGQGEREFRAEVEIISRVHHRHLVSLVGYCICREERMLVYEFVPNKTLEFHLHEKDQPVMEWAARRRIAVGSAKGLAYLHEDCHPRIIHRDIKAANILIDFNFEAMVADFGLAKLMSSDNNTHVSHVSTRVMGTFGYMAPEYAASGKLSEKSDVFSYGVVLLELITGRRPLDNAMGDSSSLVDWGRAVMRKALESEDYSEVGDPRLQGNYVPLEMARMVACAAACIRPSPSKRPRMSKILRALGGDSTLEKVKSEGLQTRDESNSCNNYYTSSSYNTSEYNADLLKFREMVMSDDQDSNEFHPLTHQSSSSTNHLQSTPIPIPTSQHHQLHLPPPNTT